MANLLHGASARFNAANAIYRPTDGPCSRLGTTSSISSITPNRWAIRHNAATPPASKMTVSFGLGGAAPSARFTMASTVPRYFCHTIRGLPSTRADSTA